MPSASVPIQTRLPLVVIDVIWLEGKGELSGEYSNHASPSQTLTPPMDGTIPAPLRFVPTQTLSRPSTAKAATLPSSAQTLLCQALLVQLSSGHQLRACLLYTSPSPRD